MTAEATASTSHRYHWISGIARSKISSQLQRTFTNYLLSDWQNPNNSMQNRSRQYITAVCILTWPWRKKTISMKWQSAIVNESMRLESSYRLRRVEPNTLRISNQIVPLLGALRLSDIFRWWSLLGNWSTVIPGIWDSVVVQATIKLSGISKPQYTAARTIIPPNYIVRSRPELTWTPMEEKHSGPPDSCNFSHYDVLYEGKAS